MPKISPIKLSWAEGSRLTSTPLSNYGFDGLCSSKICFFCYSQKTICLFLKLQLKNPKWKTQVCNSRIPTPHTFSSQSLFHNRLNLVLSLKRFQMKMATSYSPSSGTSMRLKVEGIEVIIFRNPMLWYLLLKGNSFNMPCVK